MEFSSIAALGTSIDHFLHAITKEALSFLFAVTGGETRNAHITPESRSSCFQWWHTGSPKPKKLKDAVGTENDSYSLLGLQRCPCEIVCPKGQP
jgi:hypothetical protein